MFKGFFPAGDVSPAPFGLLSVATVINHDDDHFASGTFSSENSLAGLKAELWSICGDAADAAIHNSLSANQFPDGEAFGVRVERVCSTLGINKEEHRQALLKALELTTGRSVERELWAGHHAKTRTPDGFFLANTVDTVLASGAAQPLRRALALLEGAAADAGIGEQATIHMPRSVAAALGESIRDRGDGVLTTVTGSLVAAGTGYTGLADDGTTKTFLHITGPVTVHLGSPLLVEERLAEAVNTSNNEVKIRAERPAALVVEGTVHVAVKVDLTTI